MEGTAGRGIDQRLRVGDPEEGGSGCWISIGGVTATNRPDDGRDSISPLPLTLRRRGSPCCAPLRAVRQGGASTAGGGRSEAEWWRSPDGAGLRADRLGSRHRRGRAAEAVACEQSNRLPHCRNAVAPLDPWIGRQLAPLRSGIMQPRPRSRRRCAHGPSRCAEPRQSLRLRQVVSPALVDLCLRLGLALMHGFEPCQPSVSPTSAFGMRRDGCDATRRFL
jgi:hypothetical protein